VKEMRDHSHPRWRKGEERRCVGGENGEGPYRWNEVIWDIVSSQNWDSRIDDRIVLHITLSHQFQVEH
jgi:hypothetical protein